MGLNNRSIGKPSELKRKVTSLYNSAEPSADLRSIVPIAAKARSADYADLSIWLVAREERVSG